MHNERLNSPRFPPPPHFFTFYSIVSMNVAIGLENGRRNFFAAPPLFTSLH